jgi:hypothetical protein
MSSQTLFHRHAPQLECVVSGLAHSASKIHSDSSASPGWQRTKYVITGP